MEHSIIGVAARFGGGLSLSLYWQTLVKGGTLIDVIEKERYQLNNRQTPVKWGERGEVKGMFFDEIDTFDRHIFPLSGSAIMFADPRQRLFLQICWQVLEDAGLQASSLSGKKVGVFVAQDGWYLSSYLNRIPDAHLGSQEFIVPGNDPCFLANRVSFFFNFVGPSTVVDTTCSSAFVALDTACQALESGDCDYAIVGGVSLFLNPWKEGEVTATPFETAEPDIHSFSDKASGYRTSEGCAAMLLQRGNKVLDHKHHIYGVVQATGHNSGGKTNSFAQPNKDQQISLFQTVLARANLLPEQIRYVEAHGVASQMGDAIEASALIDVFGRAEGAAPCYVSTVKPNIGHNHASSGFYAMIKGLLAFKYNQIPLIRGLDKASLNADIPAQRRGVHFLTETVGWEKSPEETARHIFFSSYGFSNVNAAIILREPDAPPAASSVMTPDKPVLVCLSANSDEQLYQQAVDLLDTVSAADFTHAVKLGDLAWTLNVGREALTHRWATTVSSIQQLQDVLQIFIERPAQLPTTIYQGRQGKDARWNMLAAQDSELEAKVHSEQSSGSLAAVAERWVAGADINWEQHWGNAKGKRIPLPTYPFAKDRYWVPQGELSQSPSDAASQFIHPFVHHNTSNFAQQRFSTTFSGEEFCLKGHVIHDIRVLPGVGHLELTRVAAHQSFAEDPGLSLDKDKKTALVLKSVVWAQIIGVIDRPQRVHIRFTNRGDGEAGYQLYSGVEEETVHNSGVAVLKELASPPVYDIDSLKSRYLSNAYSPAQYYEMYHALGLYMAPDYQGIEQLYVGMNHVLAKLALPESLEPTRQQFVLHPCLMDGALLSSVGLLMRFGDLDRPIPPKCLIPFALDEIEFHDEESQLHWAWISYSAGSSASDPFPKVDVDCCDINGKVCIRFKGFSCRGFGAQSLPSVEAEPYLLRPMWRSETLPLHGPLRSFSQRKVFLCELADRQSEWLMQDSDKCHYTVLPKSGGDDAVSGRQINVTTLCRHIEKLAAANSTESVLVQVVLPYGESLPEYAMATAILKTACQQNANLMGQMIYSDNLDGLPERLSNEASRVNYDSLLWHSAERWVPHWEAWQPKGGMNAATSPWKADSAYLIIDEAGSMGNRLASDIVEQTGSATAIVLSEPEANHHRVTIASKTVNTNDSSVNLDADGLGALLARVEQEFGALRGVVFCAGERSSVAAQQAEKRGIKALFTRYQGVSALDVATRELPLDFFVVLTGRDGILGRSGHPMFAAYCAVVNQFARDRQQCRHSPGQTLSLVIPEYQGVTEDDPISRLTLKALYQALQDGENGELMLMEGGAIERFRTGMLGVPPCYQSLSASDPDVSARLPNVEATPEQEAGSWYIASIATDLVKQVVCQAVSLPLAEIDEHALMEKYGIDSILSIKMTEKLEFHFGLLPKTLFFEFLTIHELALYFVQHHRQVLLAKMSNDLHETSAQPVLSQTPLQPDAGRSNSVPAPHAHQAVADRAAGSGDIAIIGLAGRFPKARNMHDFWQLLRDGQDCITEIPLERWDHARYFDQDKTQLGKTYGQWGGFIDGVDEFDPLFFNLSPRDARVMSPQERLFLQCAYETIEDAGYSHRTLGARDWSLLPKNTGVYAGVMYGEYEFYSIEALAKGNLLEQSIVTGSFGSIANRVSHFFNLNGPSLAVDTMCSSSLTSIYLACQALRQGDIEMALAGGVNVSIHPNKYLILGQSKFLSDDGRCRSFGQGGTGYVPSEGVGALLLKPLAKAIEDGDHIYGVIKGIAVNHGGKTNGYTVPNPVAQAEVITRAIQSSGVDLQAIGYIEAHGTGTSLGDPIEVAGLNRAFRQYTQQRAFCAIGSVKSNIGHCESAAGVAGVAKVLMQIKHRQLAPSLHSAELNSNIDFDTSPFYVQRELSDWPVPILGQTALAEGAILPRTACVSSFGAGGTNAHLVVEEYVQGLRLSPASDYRSRWVAIPLSAKTPEQRRELAYGLFLHLQEQAEWRPLMSETDFLHSIAYTLQTGREEMEERLVFVVDSLAELLDSLQAYAISGLLTEHGWVGRVALTSQVTPQAHSVFAANQDMADEYPRLRQCAIAWIQGEHIDWQRCYPTYSRPERISLPTYPFARERYWVPESQVEDTPLPAPEGEYATLFYTSDWQRCEVEEPAGEVLQPGHTDLFVIGELDEASLTELAQLPGVARINCLGSDNQDPNYLSSLVIRLVDYCQQRVRFGQALPSMLMIIAPWKSHGLPYRALSGTLRTISMEFPMVQTRLVFDAAWDGADSGVCCRNIAKEMRVIHQNDTVLYQADGHRYAWRQREIEPADTGEPGLLNPACRVVWITGGLGGLGYQVAQYIGEKTGAQLVLSGRTPMDEVKQAQLNALAELGLKAVYVRCDASQREDLENTLAFIQQRFGSLNGVIHCAGVIHDALIVNKTEQDIERVIAAKAWAAHLLDEVTQGEPLAFFVMFSSLASLGNMGQVDYAAANAFLDTLAEYRADLVRQNQRSGKSLSINWPLWRRGGMNVNTRGKKHLFDTFGIVPLDSQTALNALAIALGSAVNQFGIMQGDRQKIECYLGVAETPLSPSPASEPNAQDIEATVLHGLSRLLALNSVNINPQRLLSDYGMDSVNLSELASYLNQHYDLNFTGSSFLELATASKVIDQIKRNLALPGLPDARQTASGNSLFDGVAAKLSALLGMRCDAIEPHRQFSDYGMNSIGLMELADHINAQFSVAFSPASFLEFNTLNLVVEQLEQLLSLQPGCVDASLMSLSEETMDDSANSFSIVGYDCRYPGAENAEEYWQNIIQKKISIQGITAEEWQKRHISTPEDNTDAVKRMQASGFLPGIDRFDAGFWGIDNATAKLMDPQQRLLMRCIWQCIEHAGYDLEHLTQSKVGLFVAMDSTEYKSMFKAAGDTGGLQSGLSLGMMVNQISYFFNFTGPSQVVDNACASVFVALQQAQQAISLGECDVAIVAGVKVMLDFMEFYTRDRGGILSQSGRMAPFDQSADGYIRSEGVGAVMIKPLARARLDRDPSRATIKGISVSHNGRSAFSSMAPSVEKQEENIRNAYRIAGVEPDTIDYIEAHGSATQFNDVCEVAAFKKIFSAQERRCAVSSVKGNVGHLEAASGMASLIKVILAMKYRAIPPIASFTQLHPSLLVEDTSLYFPVNPLVWEPSETNLAKPRCAGLNSIGITGVNAHVVLEEPGQLSEPVAFPVQGEGWQLITLSAKSPQALQAYLLRWLDFAREVKDGGAENTFNLTNLAYSSQTGRSVMPYRAAIIVSDLDQLVAVLESAVIDNHKATADGLLAMGVATQTNGILKRQVKYSTERCELQQLANEWVVGSAIDWQYFSRHQGVYVDIPTYPFDEQRYWFFGESVE